MLNELPFEIIVRIAECTHHVWYSLSVTMKQFGMYSIQLKVKKNAMKRFDIEEVHNFANGSYQHHFTLHQKIHGMHYSGSRVHGKKEQIFTQYRNGLRHGEHKFIVDDQIQILRMYENDNVRQIHHFVNGMLISTMHFDENG